MSTARARSTIAGPLLVAVLVAVLAGGLGGCRLGTSGSPPRVNTAPPRPSGYFQTLGPNAWSDLPDDHQCTQRVHHSRWEPRPDNAAPNHRMPDAQEVHAAFGARPRALAGAYDARWDSWLLARVSGQHTGTTDENIQWAACKWGIADNLLRAMAVRESSWFQYEVYPDGRCVDKHGCGDLVAAPSPATEEFCAGLAAAGHDYAVDFGGSGCPKTFSIVGVMSWQDPRWGAMPGNQNGTFPFNRDSTAFALDYLGAFLRGCQEGWATWLGARGAAYRPGDIWGCVGAWYAGSWWSPEAHRYVDLVRAAERDRPWLDPGWAELRPPCAPDRGCPRGSS
jgi:hypothetical protein